MRRGRRDEADRDDEQPTARASSTSASACAPHTRSTAARRPQANSPAGRRSRTRITSTKSTDGRYTVLVGREHAVDHAGGEADREAAERRRPEAVDPADDDADEDDDRVVEREVGRDERVLHGHHHRDRGRQQAGEHDRERDHAVRAHAEQPRGAEVGGRGARVQADRRPCQQQREHEQRDDRDRDRDERDLSDVDAVDRDRLVQRGDARPRPRRACCRASRRSARSPAAGRRPRTWSRASPQATARAAAGRRPGPSRARARRRRRSRRGCSGQTGQLDVNASVYAPTMIELAVGEVDQAQHAEDEADPDRHQRVDRPEADRVGERLEAREVKGGKDHEER